MLEITVVNAFSSHPAKLHLNNFSPPWAFWCLCNLTMVGKDHLQPSWSHLKGLILLWLKMWSLSWDLFGKILSQSDSGQDHSNFPSEFWLILIFSYVTSYFFNSSINSDSRTLGFADSKFDDLTIFSMVFSFFVVV